MSLTVRVQPVLLATQWKETLDWLARVFELPIHDHSETNKFGQIVVQGSKLGVLGRDVPHAGDATSALEIEVFDIEAAVERARSARAKVLKETTPIPGAGSHAALQLPTGVILWLWEPDEEEEKHNALGHGPVNFSVGRKIRASAARVFEAVTRAEELSKFFVKKASADMREGTDVTWSWDGDVEVLEVLRVVTNETVEFVWEAYGVDYLTRVRFDIISRGPEETRLTIVESGWFDDTRGRQSAFNHAEGWTEFLLHARLWIEKGLDVR